MLMLWIQAIFNFSLVVLNVLTVLNVIPSSRATAGHLPVTLSDLGSYSLTGSASPVVTLFLKHKMVSKRDYVSARPLRRLSIVLTIELSVLEVLLQHTLGEMGKI
jgi:hypothetical protein